MAEDANEKQAHQKPDVDSLIADLFGLNIRGAKTLIDLFVRPKRVFESARINDWQGQYTPTVRLAVSILTVFSLLSFFWAGENGILFRALRSMLADIPDASKVEEILPGIFAGFVFIYPFIYILVHALMASVVFLWGTGTPWVARLRLYFGVASIGIAVASNILMLFLSPTLFMPVVAVAIILSFIAYMMTYARGMADAAPGRSGLGRGAALAVIVTLADFIASIIAGTLAGVLAQL